MRAKFAMPAAIKWKTLCDLICVPGMGSRVGCMVDAKVYGQNVEFDRTQSDGMNYSVL